jgi:hypothetical protein
MQKEPYGENQGKVLLGCDISAKYLKSGKKAATKSKNPSEKNRLFFMNVLHSLIWSSFVELEEHFLNICRARSETIWLRSYEKRAFFKFLDILRAS